jgi:hypothetical protein
MPFSPFSLSTLQVPQSLNIIDSPSFAPSMDPISALSVATGVVAFVDFTGKLVSRLFEVNGSVKGQPSHVVGVKEAATELVTITSQAERKLGELGSNYPRFSDAISRLREECVAAETQLSASLKKLTVNSSSKLSLSGSSTYVAIRSVWSEKEIKEWENKLDRIRNQVVVNVLICLW